MSQVTSDMLQGQVHYGQRVIHYTCLFASRKTLEISVHPDATVMVKAPDATGISTVESKLRKRARWIVKQQDYFNQFSPRTPQRFFIGGETHLYLGRQYQLRVEVGEADEIRLKKGIFEVTCRKKVMPQMTRRLLQNWCAQKAEEQFAASFERCWLKFRHLNVRKPDLVIKRMEKRWGGLSETATLTLNVDLIRGPKECIDYVVTHELCHLKHHDHGPSFYKFLESMLPEWRTLKHQLELKMA